MKMQISIFSPFFIVLWLFALAVLAGYCLRWWPGDHLRFVRYGNYIMPWLLVILVPGLIIAGFAHHKWLALFLGASTVLIVLSYCPLFFNFSNLAGSQSTSLKVMSYNVWTKNPNIPAVVEVIKREKPDILLLQEITKDRIANLVKELKDLYLNGQPYFEFSPNMQQGVVSRFPLSNVAEMRRKGRALKIRVDSPIGQITVINIHAYKKGWFNRHHQMQKLLMEDVDATDNPVIVGGDFNTPDKSQTYRMVLKYLNNAHQKVGFGFGFTYPTQSYRFNKKYSIPALVRIDHIFYNSHLIPLGSRTLSQSGGSDHFPVVADFALNLNRSKK